MDTAVGLSAFDQQCFSHRELLDGQLTRGGRTALNENRERVLRSGVLLKNGGTADLGQYKQEETRVRTFGFPLRQNGRKNDRIYLHS